MWSFVNVFFWQMKMLHAPSSPVNNLCMPDEQNTSRHDVASKENIKGELIKFLVVSTRILGRRTAPFPLFLIPYRVPHGFTPRC